MSFYNKGALLGNAACMNKLGDFYHSGYGVPKNQREALSWYMKAGEMKDPQALINLGTIFEEGYEGVAPDRLKAYNCYEEASKLNNPLAFFHLGLMYEAVPSYL
jgi:TPR repeat protein